jgi:hypothetical protein
METTYITSAKRKTDLQLSNLQETVRRVATAILQTADELLPQNKDDVAKNLAARSIDSVAMLGHMSHMISQLRREQIRPALKQEYASICTADHTNTPLLFGYDLVKQLKEAKETSSITQNLANDAMKKNYVRGWGAKPIHCYSRPLQSTSSYTGHRSNNRCNNYNNKAQSQPKRDFFWRGQRPYTRKKKWPQAA